MWRNVNRRWFLLGFAGLALVVGVLTASAVIGADPRQELLVKMARWAPDDPEVVALVDGVPVLRVEIRIGMLGAKAENPQLTDEDARRQAFRKYAATAAARAEAKRRGIQATRQEAEEFTQKQRQLSSQDPNARQLRLEDMKSRGLSEEEYWAQMVDAYAEVLTYSKLMAQVQNELPPSATPEERGDYWMKYQESLLAKAKIEYKDKSFQQ